MPVTSPRRGPGMTAIRVGGSQCQQARTGTMIMLRGVQSRCFEGMRMTDKRVLQHPDKTFRHGLFSAGLVVDGWTGQLIEGTI